MKTKLTLFIAVLAVALFGSGCASVPKGPPVPHAVEWNGHWYAFFMTPKTIEEARAHCEKLGGHLIIIETEEENKFAFDLAASKVGRGLDNPHIFLGAHRDPTTNSNVWIWDNGKPVDELYQGYAPGNTAFSPDRVALTMFGKNRSEDKYLGNYWGWWFASIPTDSKGQPKQGYFCEWE